MTTKTHKLKEPDNNITIEPKLILDTIVDCIQDIKGKNILVLDLKDLDDAPTDCFVICEGESSTQIKAIADNIHKRLKDEFRILPNHMEGLNTSQWILVDYFDVVVHVFYPPLRKFYDLEDLWNDAAKTKYEDV